MHRGTTSGSFSYSSKEEHSGSIKYRMHIAGCFSLRTSMTSRPDLVSVSHGNKTQLCPCSLIPLTDAWILQFKTFELKFLASVSLLSLVFLPDHDCLSATVSSNRAAY